MRIIVIIVIRSVEILARFRIISDTFLRFFLIFELTRIAYSRCIEADYCCRCMSIIIIIIPVSYTHLTLPTILRV